LGYALGDIIILILLVWDWRKNHRLNVFPFVFGLLITYHISVLYGYKFDIWQRIGDALMRIPFS